MKLGINSGATSNFVQEEMNLPKKGKSNKEVYLPDNTKLQASYKTELPFEQLTNKAREADILPGLKTPLISVNKLAKEGYTTVFHSGETGIKIHEPGTITITMTKPPILQGCKPRGAKIWTVSTKNKTRKEQKKEQANNAYDLPLISQTVKYLHKAAEFPVKDTWTKAIKSRKLQHMANNYSIHSLTTLCRIRQNTKRACEKQRQRVQSTRMLTITETKRFCTPKDERHLFQNPQRYQNDAY
jgi:hypothetical protein